MKLEEKIVDVQKHLRDQRIDGWLLYDFQNSNPLARDFLELGAEKHTTRRFFYWIPASGEPIKLVHEIEPHSLDHLPGKKMIYLHWKTLQSTLHDILKGSKSVAMEYSYLCAVPYISKVDAGTVDLVRSCGVDVVSSASLLQQYTSVLSKEQLSSMKEAAQVLEEAVEGAWEYIAKALQEKIDVTDCDVQEYILQVFARHDCITNAPPHCAINADSADPHFSPDKAKPVIICKGDFVLIDLWCKKRQVGSVYADITRVGFAGNKPSQKQQEVFSIVRKAQKTATEFLGKRFREKKEVKGCEVDEVCRQVILEAGYGKYFTHRTGHNIGAELHGSGTHLDSLETCDDRLVIAGTCCSVEPGIYLPGEFGVRLEYDLYIDLEGKIHIFGGEQDEIRLLCV